MVFWAVLCSLKGVLGGFSTALGLGLNMQFDLKYYHICICILSSLV